MLAQVTGEQMHIDAGQLANEWGATLEDLQWRSGQDGYMQIWVTMRFRDDELAVPTGAHEWLRWKARRE